MYKSYYVAKFPIDKITNKGMDDWVNDKNHVRYKYGFLETIVEHIENSNYCEPIMISYHNDGDVSAGPSGVARLYGLTTMKQWRFIPAIVVTKESLNWLADKVEITTPNQLRKYFQLEPASYGMVDGRVYWHNHNPNAKQATKTLKVSKDRLKNFLKCIE